MANATNTITDPMAKYRVHRHIVPNIFYESEVTEVDSVSDTPLNEEYVYAQSPCKSSENEELCLPVTYGPGLIWEEPVRTTGPPMHSKSFMLGLPQMGFYHRKEVSANAGAVFHDMLQDRAQVSDQSSRVCYEWKCFIIMTNIM